MHEVDCGVQHVLSQGPFTIGGAVTYIGADTVQPRNGQFRIDSQVTIEMKDGRAAGFEIQSHDGFIFEALDQAAHGDLRDRVPLSPAATWPHAQ